MLIFCFCIHDLEAIFKNERERERLKDWEISYSQTPLNLSCPIYLAVFPILQESPEILEKIPIMYMLYILYHWKVNKKIAFWGWKKNLKDYKYNVELIVCSQLLE